MILKTLFTRNPCVRIYFDLETGELMDLTHNNGARSKRHVCLREITLLLPALTREHADAPQLDYLLLVTLYLSVITLRLHCASHF